MIALDTNVLVRFLVEDDPIQSGAAKRLISRRAEDAESIFISEIVVVETIWVLGRSYELPKGEILRVVRLLLSARQLRWESSDRLLRALARWERGRGGFADYLIWQRAVENQCQTVFTFDKNLLREEGFTKP